MHIVFNLSPTIREFISLEELRMDFARISGVNSVGRDGVNVSAFKGNLDSEIGIIISKMENRSYNFTPYNEKLLPKTFDSFPRRIAIPTVRDKVALRALKRYIEFYFPSYAKQAHQLKHIRNIKQLDVSSMYVLKTDITSFYDSIMHTRLMRILELEIKDQYSIHLIRKAVNNHILPRDKVPSKCFRLYGLPQGLPISNILANIYLASLDRLFVSMNYFRYLDDILVVTENRDDAERYLEMIRNECIDLGLSLSVSKTKIANTGEGFEFLGYYFDGTRGFTIKESTLRRHYQAIKKSITCLKDDLFYKTKAPFNISREVILGRFFVEVNQLIAGAIYEGKKYGFTFYFSEVDRVDQLYALDSFTKSELRKVLSAPEELGLLKKHVKAYYSWKKGNFEDYAFNYDGYKTVSEKVKFLESIGRLSPGSPALTEAQIESLFASSVRSRIRSISKFSGTMY